MLYEVITSTGIARACSAARKLSDVGCSARSIPQVSRMASASRTRRQGGEKSKSWPWLEAVDLAQELLGIDHHARGAPGAIRVTETGSSNSRST